jgi:hypothetical protein
LTPGNDLRRFALVVFAGHLQWFYFWDAGWTERRLLCFLEDQDPDDKNAFLDGFLGAAQIPAKAL